MGKVITRKLNGMSWSLKTSLILLLTLAASLFMYQGLYAPKQSQATGTATIADCSGCHGYTNAYVDGTAINSPLGRFPGNHNKHVISNGIACSTCHTVPATATSADFAHADGSIATTGAFTFAKPTCSAATCHGGVAVTWGGSLGASGCDACHTTTTTAQFKTLAGTTTSNTSIVHVSHINNTHGYVNAAFVCGECHAAVSAFSAASHISGSLPATVTMGSTLAKTGGLNPAFSNAVNGTCSNVWCHGSGLASNTATPAAGLVLTPSFGTTLLVGSSADCSKCHGYPPQTATHIKTGTTYYTGSECYTCHSHVSSTGTAPFFTDPSKHINGIVEGGSCTGCHKSGGSGNVNGRASVTDKFDTAGYSHHVQGTSANVDKLACYACHWEADSTGNTTTHHKEQTTGFKNKVQLVVWGTSTTRPTTYGTATYELYSSGRTNASSRAELAKISDHCIGCHNDSNAATKPFSAVGDTGTPEKYSWDGTSVDARYSNTGTTQWGKFTTVANISKTQTKAFSAHGNTANQRGWSTVVDTYVNGTGYNSKVLCFDCHNSHGSSTAASSVTSSYSSATGRRKGAILKDVASGVGGYTVAYKATAGGATAQKNVYNAGAALCFDCHNSASAATAVNGGSTPWGYKGTFGFTPPTAQKTGSGILGYYDTLHFGDAGQNFISTMTFAYKGSGGSRTVNQGGHFGASATLTTAITKRTFDPGTPTGTVIQGLCTPCHDPHGASASLGTNQQYAVPMLKGTWVTSPYKQDAAPSSTNITRSFSSASTTVTTSSIPGYRIDQNSMQASGTTTTGAWTWTTASTLQTTNDTQFAGLCIGCHAKASINSSAAAASSNWKTPGRIHNSVKGWASTAGGNASNKTHAYTCSKCHTPHNARLPRLLVTNCLDVKHRGRVASGGNMSAGLTGSKGSSSGWGRFPGGGGGVKNGYFFGTKTVKGTRTCHDSSTAGGATFSTAAELWNSKSPW